MYLSLAHDVYMPLGPYLSCTVTVTVFFTSTLCSALLIISMTFERFYSIIRPHKAASFNTVKRAKIKIVCIVIFSILFNIPHVYTTYNTGWICLPFGDLRVMVKSEAMFYYWFSFVVQFVFPFTSLLVMNSVIIHTLRKRINSKSSLHGLGQSQGQNQGQSLKMKNSEKQVFVILLLVTFAFMILTTPGYLFFLVNFFVDFMVSPELFAAQHLFTNAVQKLHYTNHGINFFLYVISGQKFRHDLINLFKIKRNEVTIRSSSSNETRTSTVDLNNNRN